MQIQTTKALTFPKTVHSELGFAFLYPCLYASSERRTLAYAYHLTCAHVHMYTRAHTRMHAYTHAHMHAGALTKTPTHARACALRACVHGLRARSHKRTCARGRKRICMCPHAHSPTYVCTRGCRSACMRCITANAEVHATAPKSGGAGDVHERAACRPACAHATCAA
jgi:hypothetical protein